MFVLDALKSAAFCREGTFFQWCSLLYVFCSVHHVAFSPFVLLFCQHLWKFQLIFWSCGDVFSECNVCILSCWLLTNATNLVNKMQQDARAHHSPSFRARQVTCTFCNLWFCSVCFGVCKSLKFARPLQADKRAHHNALERKRRDHIKDSFHGLRDSVPALQGEKVSESVSWSDFVKQAPRWTWIHLITQSGSKANISKSLRLLSGSSDFHEYGFVSAAQSKHLVKPVEIFLAECEHKLCNFRQTDAFCHCKQPASAHTVVHLHSWVLSN